MWFRASLAYATPVPLLMELLDARDFGELLAFWEVEPFGEIRHEYRNALLCNLLASIHSSKTSNPKLEHFLLFQPQDQRQARNLDDIIAFFDSVTGK